MLNNVITFFVQLPERNDDPDSYVYIELLINSPLLPGSGSMLGKAIVHLHDIIHVSSRYAAFTIKIPEIALWQLHEC